MSADDVGKAKDIKRRNRDRLMALPRVVGVGVGRKIVDGRETELVAIRVYVSEKIAAEQLDDAQCVPDEVEGIPTDVIEIGDVHFLGEDNGK